MGDHTREGAADVSRPEAPGTAAEGLHPDRTFVVQLRCAPGAPGAGLVGRIEHVVSGEVLRFRSAAELIAFLTQPGHSPGAAHPREASSPVEPSGRPR
jgi:hypothetical protein